MSKDPAFLFYPGDWLGGTLGMTLEEKGAYIELLMLQFNRGHMTTHMIGQTIGHLWDKIKDKFVEDDKGLWYNVRLEKEQTKRKLFTDSRKKNITGKNQHTNKKGHKGGHMTNHMENENRDENVTDIESELFTWLKVNTPNIFRMDEPLTTTQLESIQKKYQEEKIKDIFTRMHNWKKLKNNVSANLTFRKWADTETDWPKTPSLNRVHNIHTDTI